MQNQKRFEIKRIFFSNWAYLCVLVFYVQEKYEMQESIGKNQISLKKFFNFIQRKRWALLHLLINSSDLH